MLEPAAHAIALALDNVRTVQARAHQLVNDDKCKDRSIVRFSKRVRPLVDDCEAIEDILEIVIDSNDDAAWSRPTLLRKSSVLWIVFIIIVFLVVLEVGCSIGPGGKETNSACCTPN